MTRFARLLISGTLFVGGLAAPAVVYGASGGDAGTVSRPRSASVAAAASPTSSGASAYTVRPGDSLYGIARRHRVTIGALLTANRLTLTSVIHPGQRLTIPGAASAPTTTAGAYTVRPGDSLYGIARRHRVTIGALLTANRLTLTSVIHPGQRLTIPGAATPTTSPQTPPTTAGAYTVRPGDSLYGIARRHSVTIGALLTANRLTLTSVIHPGQRLTIPGAATPTTSPQTPPTTAAPRPVVVPPRTTGPTTASAAVVERIIRDVWPDALENAALAIAWRESGYQPRAQSQCCSGLFQIYYDVHKGWLADLGIDSRNDLYDPRTNAEAALALYQRAGGWGPWALTGA